MNTVYKELKIRLSVVYLIAIEYETTVKELYVKAWLYFAAFYVRENANFLRYMITLYRLIYNHIVLCMAVTIKKHTNYD